MRISQPNYEKSVWKGHLFERVILAGTLSDKGAPYGCPLSPGAHGFAHPEPIGVTPLTHAWQEKHEKRLFLRMKVILENQDEINSKLFLTDFNVFYTLNENFKCWGKCNERIPSKIEKTQNLLSKTCKQQLFFCFCFFVNSKWYNYVGKQQL